MRAVLKLLAPAPRALLGKPPLRRRRAAPSWEDVRWPFLAYAGAIVALAYSRRRLELPRPPMVPLVSTVPLAVAAALPRSKLEYGATWASYVWLFKVAWEIPYDKPDKLRPRLRITYPVRIDSLIGAGEPPGLRLQRALRHPPRLTALDAILTALHYTLWLAPHIALGWVLMRHEQRFPRVAGRLAAVYHFTTLGYWYVPTAPPWWASEQRGEMNGALQRVTREVGSALRRKLRGREQGSNGADDDPQGEGNPWGSMPSDALPALAITARSLSQIDPKLGATAWGLTALDAFTLVYLGEHYVTDLLVGLALVELIWRGEPLALPFVRAGVAALRGLERLAS
jgi:membrane-associated phospholipid phosphatase